MRFDSDALAAKLLPLIKEVQEPLMITITTPEQCVILGNKAMKQQDPKEKAMTYLFINNALVGELAEYQMEEEEIEDDSHPYL